MPAGDVVSHVPCVYAIFVPNLMTSDDFSFALDIEMANGNNILSASCLDVFFSRLFAAYVPSVIYLKWSWTTLQHSCIACALKNKVHQRALQEPGHFTHLH